MVLGNTLKKISALLNKYRYVFLIIVIGLVLIAIPVRNENSQPEPTQQTQNNQEISLEDRLSKFLSMIDGAGEVRVILTVAEGEEIIYQMNERYNSDDNSTNTQMDTVTVTAADRDENGLVKQINPQIFLGAVIICSGANDPVIRLSIVDAVSKLTGLGANQISVLKMK